MSITDELRDCIRTANRSYEDARNPYNDREILHIPEEELLAIADRIDEQHEEAIKKLSADFEGQLYCESFVNWAVMDKFAAKQRDLEARVSTIERKLNHRGER